MKNLFISLLVAMILGTATTKACEDAAINDFATDSISIQSTNALDPFDPANFVACQVATPNLGNPHRIYDAKFRACGALSIHLGFVSEQRRACIAYCMKN